MYSWSLRATQTGISLFFCLFVFLFEGPRLPTSFPGSLSLPGNEVARLPESSDPLIVATSSGLLPQFQNESSGEPIQMK